MASSIAKLPFVASTPQASLQLCAEAKTLNNKEIKNTEKNINTLNKDAIFVENYIKDLTKENISEIDIKEISSKYSVPQNLLDLVTKQENGLLALKFIEIIGEDEISNLDPETIYFIVNILNKAKLFKFRNKVLNAALPLRV